MFESIPDDRRAEHLRARQPSPATSGSIYESEEDKRLHILEEGKKWARSVTSENAWDKLVLTLDGGGIRGYSSLLILEALMKRVAHYEKELNDQVVDVHTLLPCHYFDYMWGTSTGGLIAIMLGRLRMSVAQALSVYRDVGESIFGKRQRRTLGGANIFATRYNHANVERAVKKITRQYCREHAAGTCSSDDTLLWTDLTNQGVYNDNDLCQAVCITARTTDGKSSQALPLRSYHYEHHASLPSPHPYLDVEDLDLLIWEAARATSAAPFYFKMYSKRDKRGILRRYKDGGTILNNPAEIALNEVRNRYGVDADGNRKDPALLLSIGTGIRYDTPFATTKNPQAYAQRADVPLLQSIRERLAIAKHILMRYTEGENTHRTIRRNIVDAEHLWYKRLNVDVGLGNMDLADWRKGAWRDSSSHNDNEEKPSEGSQSPINNKQMHPGRSQSHNTSEQMHSEGSSTLHNSSIEEMHSGGSTLTDIENATRNYLTRDDLHKANEIEWSLLPKEMLDHTAERMVRHRLARRNGINRDNERSWHTYQGRWSSGQRTDPWDNDSRDWPKSPASSVEDLKGKRP